jgi:hypothetical protein
MRTAFFIACLTTLGCAHIDRQQALTATPYDVMTDAEIANVAVAEALGELHQVSAIDAEGVVTSGRAAFNSRTERLAFERRVDAILRGKIYGQGPTLQLVRIRCEQLHKAGWAGWPGDANARRNLCEYGDVSMTVHSLFKKPLLQRAFIDVMLEVTADSILSKHVKTRLLQLERSGVEPYLLMVERWDRVEGFRPRG